jgi:hypothetical protein
MLWFFGILVLLALVAYIIEPLVTWFSEAAVSRILPVPKVASRDASGFAASRRESVMSRGPRTFHVPYLQPEVAHFVHDLSESEDQEARDTALGELQEIRRRNSGEPEM